MPYTARHVLDEWAAVNISDVEKLISSAVSKTCQLDPAPTWLIKECCGPLAPFITLLINKSLATGCFPASFKHAVIFPLLKKNDMDPGELKNFRPVSNLPLLSKLTERVVQIQLQAYLDTHGMMSKHQSAYRKFHSTETALARIYNDLLVATDEGKVSAICLLDLTAAFDTVDHDLILMRLQRSYGIQSHALAWFRSYLTGRTYCVVFSGKTSASINVTCSVPQGSVLGPQLFSLYTAELADLASKYGVTLHAYADDNQLYVHCSISEAEQSARNWHNASLQFSIGWRPID